jgi:hypothetical protein
MAANSSIAATARVTNADFIKRYDVRTLGDLLSDLGVRITAVSTDTTLTEFLSEAEGEVLSKIRAGKRYTAADIALLAGVDLAYYKRLVVDNALNNLLNRRPDPARPVPPNVTKSLATIAAVAAGLAIFTLEDQSEAGVQVSRADTPTPRLTTNLIRVFGVILPEDNL